MDKKIILTVHRPKDTVGETVRISKEAQKDCQWLCTILDVRPDTSSRN